MAFRGLVGRRSSSRAGIMVSLRRHPAQPQLWVRAGFVMEGLNESGSR